MNEMTDTTPHVQMPKPDLLKQMNEDFWPINHRLIELGHLDKLRGWTNTESVEFHILKHEYWLLQKYFKLAGYTPVYNGKPGKLLK